MIISHSHKFIFIKSHKTGGTSVEAALSQHCTDEDVVTPLLDYPFNRDENGEWIHKARNHGDFHQHNDALSIRSKVSEQVWQDYFKFSITRNPWDRAVSFFSWETRQDPTLIPHRRFYHYLGIPFSEIRKTRKLFAEYIKGDWTNNDAFYTIDGQLCVDFVIRYEQLEEDYNKVCDAIGIPKKGLPRLKSGIRKTSLHYSEYYNDITSQIVADRSQIDLRLFSYHFERQSH